MTLPGPLKTTCPNCATEVSAWPYQLRDGKRPYCSYSCRSIVVHTGRRCNAETKMKMSISRLRNPICKWGPANASWRGGVTPLNKKIRGSARYAAWRRQVFERDNYTCQFCEKRGGRLHADHIKPFSTFPELRFDVSNGRTLCAPCHRTTPTWGSRALKQTYG
jgi:5-methylcytosine-specific restriction endonuclease McrA